MPGKYSLADIETPKPPPSGTGKYSLSDIESAPAAAPEGEAPASLGDLVPKSASEWGDAALSFLKGAVVNPVKGIASQALRIAQGPQTLEDWAAFAFLGPMGPQVLDMAKAQAGTAEKAIQAGKEGRVSEAAGYGAAALLPGVGPMAAGIGEKIGDLQIAEGLGEMASPAVLGGAAKAGSAAASRVAAPVRTATANPTVRAAATKIASHIPGSGLARDLAGFVRSVSEALKKAEAPPEQVPPQSGPVIRMGPVTEPLSVEAPPVSVPTKTGPKSAPRKSVRTKKVQEPDDAGTPLPPETEAETAARVRAHNEAFWTPRENPKASRTFAPSEKATPTKAETVEQLSRGINEAIGETPAPSKLEFPAKVYAESARSAKATALAKTLHEGGISLEDARLMKQQHWEMAAKAARVKTPSLDTVQRVLFELRKLEKATK